MHFSFFLNKREFFYFILVGNCFKQKKNMIKIVLLLYLFLTIKLIYLNDKLIVEASLNNNNNYNLYNEQLQQHQHNHNRIINKASHFIEIADSNCFNETCYSNMSDIYNSPLVECALLLVI